MDPEKKNISPISSKSPEIISYFENNEQFVFIFKKTEKLVSAVYLVTNLFPGDEPMRFSLRKKSSELLSFIISYKDTVSAIKSDFTYEVKTRVLELVSCLQVSNRAGLLSDMNFSILKQEFSNLIDLFESPYSVQKDPSNSSLSDAFFEDRDREREKPRDMDKTAQVSRENRTLIFKKSDRHDIILGLLKKKAELTIKDVAEIIKDCSEKTIQRELNALIQNGILKRIGERRWSKYSLI